MDSAWLTMSRLRPVHSCRSTWLNGSNRAPNLLLVRRTPLATARTLPCLRVSTVTMRSASPSFWVRRTTPSSRYSDFGVVDTSVPQPVELLGVILPLAEDRHVQVQVHPRAEQRLHAVPRLGADLLDDRAAPAQQHGLLAGALDVEQRVDLDQLAAVPLGVGTAGHLLDGDRQRVRHLLEHLLQGGLADQLGDLPLDVLVGGLFLRVERRTLGQQADEQVLEQLDLVAAHCAHRHDLGGLDQLAGGQQLLGDLLLRRGVDLGHHDDDRRLHLAQLPGDEPVAGADGLVGRYAEDDDVDLGEGVADDVVEPAAQQALGLVQAGGVDQHQLPARAVDDAADRVPGGLRPVADDADLLADQGVGQRGLARVGAAHQTGETAPVRRLVRWCHARPPPTRGRHPRVARAVRDGWETRVRGGAPTAAGPAGPRPGGG